MSQVESIYSTFIEGGYGEHSNELTLHLAKFLSLLAKVKNELRPTDLQLNLTVLPNTRVEITIKSP